MLLEHLHQPEYVHVLLNPLPVYGAATTLFVLVAALVARSRSAQMIGLLVLSLLGPATWVAVEYGEKAYDRVYSMSNADAQAWLDVHKKRAENSQYVFYLMALTALVALIAHRRPHKSAKPLTWLALALALISVNLAAWISQAGGQVRHSEFREGPPG
jgi:hypothetical protein